MIIHRVTLQNFGIYAGEHTFDLTPHSDGRFQQPIILLRGQNGVGKSTFMEAIRLALHGKLSRGNRATQKEYEQYLTRRLHRATDGVTAPFAAVQLEFDHVFLGQRHHYRVYRSWGGTNQRPATTLNVWIDGEPGPESDDEKEYLLRELVPPGVGELFFFDGEKISTLAEAGDASDALLAETVKNLLGLHLVEQLDRDLDIYLMRQSGVQEMRQYQEELARLDGERTVLEEAHREITTMLADCRRSFQAKRAEITLLKEKIAQQGGEYAAAQQRREAERTAVAEALAQTEQEIQDLGRGLLPFMVAPKMLSAVRQRLEQEAAFAEWQAAQSVLQAITPILAEPTESEQIERIRQAIIPFSEPPMLETAVIHRVSSEKRGVLLNWIDEALTVTPGQLADILNRRASLQAKLAELDEALKRTPIAQVLAPLQEELEQRHQELGHIQADLARLTADENSCIYRLERTISANRRVSEKMSQVNMEESRLKMAARTKLLLDQYQRQLIQRKLVQLSQELTKRFNQLSHKRNLIERVAIDPDRFTVMLYGAGKSFSRHELSAGEEQIFAIATLWALREVSGRPLPVIIDTPLSRLDDAHRRAMLAEFMPQVAQQVIVLATTTEIDEATFRFMQPAVSRAYLLQADSTTSQVTEQPLTAPTVQVILEEVGLVSLKA